ncbi:MAG: hypothetical protein H6726_19330 [Sandaracinaceae bacterium]|nr:hypothetical protein [Sandaracinaceae bacterium]
MRRAASGSVTIGRRVHIVRPPAGAVPVGPGNERHVRGNERPARGGWRAACGALLVALGGAGCGGGPPPPTQSLVPLFEGSRVELARQAAPELMAQAEAARDEAARSEREGQTEDAGELATEARLWLAAALAEADAQALDRERASDTEAAERAAGATLQLEREREAVVSADADAQAAQLASATAQRAFEHAAGYEARRLRRDDPDTRALYRETSLALQQRTAALLAAARAMGAPTADVDRLEQQLATLRTAPRAELVVAEADALLSDASALLGAARRGHGADPNETAALIEAAGERGLQATRSERGLQLHGRLVDRPERAALQQLAALLAAHPRGVVQILVLGPRARTAALRRKASALQAGLARAGVPAERVTVVEVSADMEEPGLRLALPAY